MAFITLVLRELAMIGSGSTVISNGACVGSTSAPLEADGNSLLISQAIALVMFQVNVKKMVQDEEALDCCLCWLSTYQ